MSVAIVTDSASCVSHTDAERLGIGVASLYIVEDAHAVPETDIDACVLYERLLKMETLPTTSQPTPADLERVLSEPVLRGEDVLGVFISAKMSSTFEAAQTAAHRVRERYPDARIVLVDSESNSLQEGFAVLSAAERAAAGGDLDECEAAARETIRRTRFLFAPSSLEYLARGGRISGAARLLGSALRIVPVLTAQAGTTGVATTVRTQTRALGRIAQLMRADVERYGLRRAAVQVVADDEGAARFARESIEPIVGGEVPVVAVGAVVGVHVGPAIGVAYETVEPMR